ncbi:hypothetical protein PYW07_009578 [Mythimna separata]|uniref:Uncharacterized protein n=1 Tax=Mythimna separata TaxID=271217 RepID=A0AAD8DNF8_MYTSE|nr:hypothetical protein PYW07_009578 [Mythimna separata]
MGDRLVVFYLSVSVLRRARKKSVPVVVNWQQSLSQLAKSAGLLENSDTRLATNRKIRRRRLNGIKCSMIVSKVKTCFCGVGILHYKLQHHLLLLGLAGFV